LASVPKAYINWILFDEQFKPVSSGSGFDLISTTPDAVKSHHSTVNIATGGYLYVYCSNESNIDVFFDNLQVIHTRGPLLETTDYYPFGLTMAGISSKGAGGIENKYKFNKGSELQNKEFSDGSGLELYATNFRSLDPQLGRWWQIDPKPDNALSLYSALENNPILHNDPLGDTVRYKDNNELNAGIQMINSKLNGMYEVQVTKVKDGDGYTNQATLVKTKDYDKKKMTSEQKNFVKEYNKASSATSIVRQEFVDKDPNTVVGSWVTGKVDISDVKAFDNQKGGPTSLSAYSHELIEQLGKAKLGMCPGDAGTLDKNGIPNEYKAPHQQGIQAENFVSGTTRDENTQIYTDGQGNKVQAQIINLPNGSIEVKKTTIQ
jgi:RHS repeat-associated protein